MLTVIIFSKLISLIYFNLFIEDFELLMLVSSLIYLAFFFCTGNKSCFLKMLWVCFQSCFSYKKNHSAWIELLKSGSVTTR